MLEVRIQEVARQRTIQTAKGQVPIDNLYRFALAINRPVTTAKRIWEGNFVRIELQMLETVCLALDCQPGDLLVLTKNSPKKSARKR